MGGSSKSSNSTSNHTSTKNTDITNAFNADMNGSLVTGIENSTVTVTDNGAVKAALEAMTNASKSAIDGMVESNKRTLTHAEGATKDAMDVISNLSLNTDAGTAQEMTKYFMIGAVGLAVAIALRGKL